MDSKPVEQLTVAQLEAEEASRLDFERYCNAGGYVLQRDAGGVYYSRSKAVSRPSKKEMKGRYGK